MTLYAEDGLLKDSKFEPIDDASISTRRIEYTQFQVGESLVRVPLKYIRDSKAIGKPETENDTSVKFKNFSDESALPPFTVSDMGLPQGASIKRAFPDNRIERIDWDRFVELSNK